MNNQSTLWSAPEACGWLEKRGGDRAGWKRRYCALQGSYLFYFHAQPSIGDKVVPSGVVPLEGCGLTVTDNRLGLLRAGIHQDEGADRYPFSVTLAHAYQDYVKRATYVFAAPSSALRDEWVSRVARASDTRAYLNGELLRLAGRLGELSRLLRVQARTSMTPAQSVLMSDVSNGQSHTVPDNYTAAHAANELSASEQNIIELQDILMQARKKLHVLLEQEGENLNLSNKSALRFARARFEVLRHYTVQDGNASALHEESPPMQNLRSEMSAAERLISLLHIKKGYLQGKGLEKLTGFSRIKLQDILRASLGIITSNETSFEQSPSSPKRTVHRRSTLTLEEEIVLKAVERRYSTLPRSPPQEQAHGGSSPSNYTRFVDSGGWKGGYKDMYLGGSTQMLPAVLKSDHSQRKSNYANLILPSHSAPAAAQRAPGASNQSVVLSPNEIGPSLQLAPTPPTSPASTVNASTHLQSHAADWVSTNKGAYVQGGGGLEQQLRAALAKRSSKPS